jgi:hypothetical protein
LEALTSYDDMEASLVADTLKKCRFIVLTRLDPVDITDEGYDFNGWILEFYQENCDGIVQVDGKGFYSPKGSLIVDMSANAPEE